MNTQEIMLHALQRIAMNTCGDTCPQVIAGDALRQALVAPAEPEQCWCDAQGIGKPGVSCGDCPRDYGKPAQQPAKWLPGEIKDGYKGIRWVTKEGVFGRPTADDVRTYLAEIAEPARTLAAPVTDEEIDAAFVELQLGLIYEATSVEEMKRALEGFAAGRAAGVEPAVVPDDSSWRNRAVFLIHYDDQDMRPETWTGEAAGRARFKAISTSWNAHLFVKVASNSRDDYRANNNAPMLAAAPQPAAQPAVSTTAATDLHAEIMNLPCGPAYVPLRPNQQLAYKIGHRDARHAAAELVASKGATNE